MTASAGQDPSSSDASAELQSEADQIRTTAKWLLASLGGVATVLVAGLQLATIGSVPSGTRLFAAVAGACVALVAVVGLIALVLEVLMPSDLSVEDLSGPGACEYRNYIKQYPSMLAGFENVDQLITATRDARLEAKRKWVRLHEHPSQEAQDEAEGAERWAGYLEAIQVYVLKRLTLRDLRSRFNWKRHAVALLAAVAVGGGVMAFAWGANPPKASSPSVTLRGANLAGASFDGADLSNVDFTGANLNGANFTNTTLTGVVWRNTICPDGTNSDADGGTCLGHLGG